MDAGVWLIVAVSAMVDVVGGFSCVGVSCFCLSLLESSMEVG